jgi:hypothetical protein
MLVEDIVCQDNPFDPDNHAAYEAWRTHKLEGYPRRAEELIVEVNDPCNLSDAEREAILVRCAKTNMAIYRSNTGTDPDKLIPATLGAQLGLRRLWMSNGGVVTSPTPIARSTGTQMVTTMALINRFMRCYYIASSPRQWVVKTPCLTMKLPTSACAT